MNGFPSVLASHAKQGKGGDQVSTIGSTPEMGRFRMGFPLPGRHARHEETAEVDGDASASEGANEGHEDAR